MNQEAQGSNIVDQGSLHKYRTEIPNTVVRGLKSRGLSVHTKWLYVYLKSVTGDSGVSYRSTATMAEESGMSRAQVSASKKALARKGLIVVVLGKNPRRDPDQIQIKDIWPLNYEEFRVHHMNTDQHDISVDKYGNEVVSVHHMNTEDSQCSPYEQKSSPYEQKSSPYEQKSSPYELGVQEVVTKKIPLRRSPEEEETSPPVVPQGDVAATASKATRSTKPRTTLMPTNTAEQDRLWAAITDPDFMAWFAKKGLALNLEEQWERFVNHALANGRQQVDWRRAFMGWLTSPYQRQPRGGPTPEDTHGLTPKEYRTMRNAQELIEESTRDTAGPTPLLPGPGRDGRLF